MRKSIFLLAFVILVFPQWCKAQKRGDFTKFKGSKKQRSQPFPSATDFRPGGWLVGAGLTTLAEFSDNEIAFTEANQINFADKVSLNPQFLPGVMLEVGRFYNFKENRIFKYIDYSLGYKMFAAGERFEYSKTNKVVQEGSHQTTQHFASLNFNINNIIPLNEYMFINNGLGINADIRFLETYTPEYPIPMQNANPGSIIGQLHYKLGIGYMLDTDMLVETSIETSLFNLFPQQTQFSQLNYFNLSYQPFILRIRFFFFRLADSSCPKVGSPDIAPGFRNGYGD
jgi:hypothetical protein